jgi:hypothetical protein
LDQPPALTGGFPAAKEEVPERLARRRAGHSDGPTTRSETSRPAPCFGTYTVDEASKTIKRHIEASSYPNLVGDHLQALLVLTGERE